MKTINQTLKWAYKTLNHQKGNLDPQKDSEVILAHILKKNRNSFYSHPEKKIKFWQSFKFRYYIKKRAKLYPLAYILKYKYFYNLKLDIIPGVFIPRPETEIIVEEVLNYIKEKNLENIQIAEIGGGSGAIALSLLNNCQKIKKYHINDISVLARKNIKKNAIKLKLDKKLKIYSKANFKPFENLNLNILISNPPYVPYQKYKDSVTIQKEPIHAITDKADGTLFYKKLFSDLKKTKNNIPYIILEIDESNNQKIYKLFQKYFDENQYSYQCLKDLNNLDRTVIIKNLV
jgi:release factor glutamine methyltransferase